ncbi:MAG TPA: type II toxin-antitoxin system VapC family toxin [Candidatus Bathyarchaeia archaeon]
MTFLDTSIIIDFLAGDQRIIATLKEILNKEEVKTTTITEYELLRHKTKIKKQAAEKFLSGVIVCSFDRDAAKKAAVLFQELQDAGRMVNENDLLIAGIALAHDEVLLTRDQKLASIGIDKIKTV